MKTPASAARLYRARGWQPIPIPGRTKRPRGNEWQFLRYTESDAADFDAIFSPSGNIGLLLGVSSGGLVDVDLDCAEAIELARTYLPPTGMVSGRISKPRSHYWYIVKKPQNTRQYRDPMPKSGTMLVELRSSDGTKGFQTIVPPSLHESQLEQISWVSEDGEPGDPGDASFEELETAVRLIAAGALLAKYFPAEGQRHYYGLALGGLLLRYGTPVDAARTFVYEVCRTGGSTNPDLHADAVYGTAQKLEEGQEVTGGRTLIEIIGEGGEKVISKVCEWLELRDAKTSWLDDLIAKTKQASSGDTKSTPNDPTGTAPSSGGGGGDDPPENWAGRLKKNSKDDFLSCPFNAYEILKNCEGTRGRFRWDDVAREIVVSPGEFAEIDPETLPLKVAHWLTEDFDMVISEEEVGRQILCLAMENKFDPIQDYLNSLVWDQLPRVSSGGGWLSRYANVEVPPEEGGDRYVEVTGRKWLFSMVARAYEPGCKADLVLIVEGLQGKRKSSLFEALAGPTLKDPRWYCDLAIAIGDKDSKMLTSGFWLAELPDLAALKKTAEQNAVKAFFSLRYDKFRPPYGKRIIHAPRRVVFGGTTNELQYLADTTGNRRYCPVKCNARVDLGAFERDRDQIFAEMVYLYKKHLVECVNKLECCCWWFTPEEEKLQEGQTRKRQVESTESDIVAEWWYMMAPEDRPEYVRTLDVARKAFGYTLDKIPGGLAMRLAAILTDHLHFEREQRRVDGKPSWVYVPSKEQKEAPQSEKGKAGPTKGTDYKAKFQTMKGGKA